MNSKKIFVVALAALMLFAACAFAACTKNKDDDSAPEVTMAPSGENTEAPSEAPTAEPTEAEQAPTDVPEGTEQASQGFTAEPINDFSAFNKPLDALCALVQDPGFANMKALFPEQFFTGLSDMLNSTLEDAGMSLSDLGYDSFDALLEDSMGEMDFAEMLDIEGIDSVEKAEYRILSGETADVEKAKAAIADVMEYLDDSKVTNAYKLNVDFTVSGSGKSETNNSDIWFYEYDGELYILFGDM